MSTAVSAAWAVRLGLMIALLALFAVAAPGEARAQSCTAAVTPNATFGTVDGLTGGPANTTATLNFDCTGLVPGIPVTLCPNLDAGSGGGDGAGGRLLVNGADTVGFQIYQDSNRTVPWGSSGLLQFGATPTITATPGANGKVNVTRTLYAKVTVPVTAKPKTFSSAFSNQNFFWGLNLLTCAGITVGFSIPPPTFNFDVAVSAGCTVSGTTLGFGNVGVLATAKAAQNDVVIHCTNGTSYSVGLGNGLNGTSATNRRMAKGAERVTYGIYKDAGYSQPWGDLSAGLGFVRAATGTGVNQTFQGYGRAPAQATPSPGAYADTVVATITY